MTNNTFNQETLKKLIQDASPGYKQRKKLNQSLSIGIGLLGIGFSLGATISGVITQDAKISAIFGACAATSQAILFAYPVEKRSRTYSILFARNENLQTELEVRQQTDEELQKILEEFKLIRIEAAREEAVSGKLEEVKEPSPEPPPGTSQQSTTTQPV